MDFIRKNLFLLLPLLIDDRTAEIVQIFKFLGITSSSNVMWKLNVDTIIKKAQQRLYLLRMLRSFGLTTQIMLTFYRVVIECSNIINNSMVWVCHGEGNLRLNGVVKTASTNRQRPSQSLINVSAAPVRKN